MLLYVHKAFKDDHSCSDIQLSVAQKIDSCPARKVGPLPKKLMRNGNEIKKFVLVAMAGLEGKRVVLNLGSSILWSRKHFMGLCFCFHS